MICRRSPLRAGLIILYCSAFILIALSVIEVFHTIAEVVRALEKANGILLVGALTASFVPSAAILFWVCKVIALELHLPIEKMLRYFHKQGKA
jgi:hypothetical protein